MFNYKEPWKERIAWALNKLLEETGLEARVTTPEIIAEIPPSDTMGDLGFPMFSFAKLLRKAPPQIAQAAAAALSGGLSCIAFENGTSIRGEFKAAGPYVNLFIDRGAYSAYILSLAGGTADRAGADKDEFSFGRPGTLQGRRIMVEFSSPNTNKPLHLGHLRNDILGESISRILAACGAEVRKVCIINDRGIHICKSMLAYKEFGGNSTPESAGVKSDRFVGDWYVRFHKMSQEDPDAEARAREMLRKWEAGDRETTELWRLMNDWAVNGMKQTYRRTGVSFDTYYFESRTYLLGKDEVLKGLERGLFYREGDGAVAADLSAEKLDKKVLLRKDGTSIYITQDIGTAIYRHKDWPFDRLIFVVGSEQQYHFKVLFTILDKLGFSWAKNLYHLSYGMVNLPEGKMKSREGTVVDADDLLDSLKAMALEEIREKEREEAVGNPEEAAEKIALGALHYYLLSVSPAKDMLFNPKESLSFTGNTGPYQQYMGARISALLRKASLLHKTESMGSEDSGKAGPEGCCPNSSALLTGDAEWELVRNIAAYPEAVNNAAETLDPSVLQNYLYELSKAFSRFYHDCPILGAEPPLASARLALVHALLAILRDCLYLINIPFLEAM
ncbi:MAG: arginine--tRNA ligase [Treponema sp.]|jgi:arginyl-tRNA synthetase|nr:arginine--tRNA ligase [Treponema sp.]